MTDCNRLSDRMPAVAHGNAAWNAEEARHLAACDECRLEWQLVRHTVALGTKTVPPVSPVVVAEVVRRRLRVPEGKPAWAARRREWTVAGLVAAACLALVIWGTREKTPDLPSTEIVAEERDHRDPAETGRLEFVVPELDDLDVEELKLIMGELDNPFRADELLESPSWGDLEQRAIERGFSIWEG